MYYIALNTINIGKKILKRGELLPDNISKDKVKFFLERGAVTAVNSSGEIVDDPEDDLVDLAEETEEGTEEETEEESPEEEEEIEISQDPPEVDVLSGIVTENGKRGKKRAE